MFHPKFTRNLFLLLKKIARSSILTYLELHAMLRAERKFLTGIARMNPFWLAYHHFRSQTLMALHEMKNFLKFVFHGNMVGSNWKIPATEVNSGTSLIGKIQENILRFYLETSDVIGLKSLLRHGISVNTEINGNSLLVWAIEKQDSALASFLIELGAHVDARDMQNQPVLLKACRRTETAADSSFDSIKMAAILLKNGAEANVTDRNGDPAALAALAGRNMPLFRLLIESGADVNQKGKCESLLAAAVRMQLSEAVQLLLEQGAEITPDSDGRPLLHLAVLMNSPEIVKLLLQHGADVKERNELGETPFLLNAGGYCSESIAEALLDAGADVNERTPDGSGVFHTGLYEFDAEKDARWFDFLLSHGADIKMKDNEGITPFEFAMQLEKLPLMDFLLSRGTDPNGDDKDAMSPLMKAVLKNRLSTAELLLKHHADPTVRCGNKSPLEYVAKHGSKEMKKLFEPFSASLH